MPPRHGLGQIRHQNFPLKNPAVSKSQLKTIAAIFSPINSQAGLIVTNRTPITNRMLQQ